MTRKLFMLVFVALVLAIPGTAGAAIISGPTGATSGTVDSGQTYYTVFNTQRTADSGGFRIRQVTSSPSAEGRYVAYNCSATAQISYQYILANQQQQRFYNSSGGLTTGCFRVGLRRQSPADTNGWLPGNGNTTFTLEALH